MKLIKTLTILFILLVALFAWANHHSNSLQPNTKAGLILIEKSKRSLTLFQNGVPLKTYKVALGRNPVGRKEQEGDGRTPEGVYRIDSRKADSAFHRALHISYPGPADIEAAKLIGASPGGAIMIHGIRNGMGWLGRFHRLFDWTAGCIALTNWEIEEIWEAVPDGTPVEVRP